MIGGLYLHHRRQSRDGRPAAAGRGGPARAARPSIQYRDKAACRPARDRPSRHCSRTLPRRRGPFPGQRFAEWPCHSGADGVHLGQGDLAVGRGPRGCSGRASCIGVSTRTVDQALQGRDARAPTTSAWAASIPPAARTTLVLVGLETLKKVRRAVKIPLVAIGGITPDNAGEVIDAGADARRGDLGGDGRSPARRWPPGSWPCCSTAADPLPRGRVLTVAGSDSGRRRRHPGRPQDHHPARRLRHERDHRPDRPEHPAACRAFIPSRGIRRRPDRDGPRRHRRRIVKTGMLFSAEIVAPGRRGDRAARPAGGGRPGHDRQGGRTAAAAGGGRVAARACCCRRPTC